MKTKITPIIISIGFIFLLGCSGGVTVPNIEERPRIIGKVKHESGDPASNAIVQFIPYNYNPVTDSSLCGCLSDTTDDNGNFSLSIREMNSYNLFASHSVGGTKKFRAGIVVTESEDTIRVQDITLQKTGRIIVNISRASIPEEREAIYLPGTNIYKQIDSTMCSACNSVVIWLDSMPTGILPPVAYFSTEDTSGIKTMRDSLVVDGVNDLIVNFRKKYSVSTTGSDGNNGVSAPFATLARACSVIQGGDTIMISAGTYKENNIHLKITGEELPVLIKADSGAIMKATGVSDTGLIMSGYSYITVDGLMFEDYSIGLAADSGHNLVFNRCGFKENRSTALSFTGADTVTVTNCYFIVTTPPNGAPDNDNENFGVSFSGGTNINVENSVFTGVYSDAIRFTDAC